MRIAIAGLGNIGAEVARQCLDKAELYAQRAEGPITVTDVSARDRGKDRGFDLRKHGIRFWKDPTKMASEADVDIVVELIGGADGVALRVVEVAIARGVHVVTANKALLAKHGMRLSRLAEARGVTLAFEAAVAGGIPVVELLRQGLAANVVTQIVGILNGTTNFILSQMLGTGCSYDAALKQAQQRGYAEADPTLDVNGMDAAAKLAILSALAFGVPVDLSGMPVEGIERITALDIQRASQLGLTVKLLCIARNTAQGLERWVQPCLVPADSVIGKVVGATNAVAITGEPLGTLVIQGQGAGAGPTASAVIADIIDLATGRRLPAFGKLASELRAVPELVPGDRKGEYYLRLQAVDQPRVLGDVLSLFGMQGISMGPTDQPDVVPDEHGAVPVFLTTRRTQEAAVQRALIMIRELTTVKGEPCLMRIERNV